jgi:CelD/BcsL family acetyltransferase involved in cellulose biosynthesis
MSQTSASLVEPTLDLEEITDLGRLADLGAEWGALCDRCPWTTPFQRPEWLLPWCRHFDLTEPWAISLRHDGRLVAFLPLYVYTFPRDTDPETPLLLDRIVAILGHGNSDYLDLIAEPGHAAAAAALCLQRVGERTDLWEICQLDQLRAGSPLLEAPLPLGWTELRKPQDACPILELPPGTRELADLVPGRQMRNLRRLARHAAQAGGTRLERADAVSGGQLFDALARLHGSRWNARGMLGILAGEEARSFHREVVELFTARGALALHSLAIGGEIAAVTYGFYEERELFYYLGSFDPRWSHCGPGALLIGEIIQEAIHNGCERFNFLRGREPYKYFWGAKDCWNTSRILRHGRVG